ncbi:uncharacterized protein TM35_001031010 [Trypanosoma theileri]|uniref:Uncharacterized protein n=1 Tax=Trypanosoma theileri TaxID=67003 RepID=A0A1X0NE41_9TRYP|nr:uncharacterized protein TM35_001031010 [Trypanosoma theileri]ORC81926.1 hypothetical protein TM35_001031010 [Trypanosoma theileri]
MEANAFTNEPNGTVGDGDFKCTPDSSGTCTVTGDVFTTLFKEEVLPTTSDSTESSNSGTTRSSTAKGDHGPPQEPVETAQEGVRAGQPTLSTNPGTSLQENQNDPNGLHERERGQLTVLPSTAQEQSRGVKDSSSVTSAPQPGHSRPDSEGEPNGEEQIQPAESTPTTEGNPGSSNNTGDQTTTGDSNTTEQASPAESGTTGIEGSQGNGNADATATRTNTTTEAPTTTPSPVPVTDPKISSTITSNVQKNKANVDSSISPVWMRTAAPLLIMAVLFSVTLY